MYSTSSSSSNPAYFQLDCTYYKCIYIETKRVYCSNNLVGEEKGIGSPVRKSLHYCWPSFHCLQACGYEGRFSLSSPSVQAAQSQSYCQSSSQSICKRWVIGWSVW